MKKGIFAPAVLLMAYVPAEAADKVPLPQEFSGRMSVIIENCGAVPLKLAVSVALFLLVTAAAIIYYVTKEEKREK